MTDPRSTRAIAKALQGFPVQVDPIAAAVATYWLMAKHTGEADPDVDAMAAELEARRDQFKAFEAAVRRYLKVG